MDRFQVGETVYFEMKFLGYSEEGSPLVELPEEFTILKQVDNGEMVPATQEAVCSANFLMTAKEIRNPQPHLSEEAKKIENFMINGLFRGSF